MKYSFFIFFLPALLSAQQPDSIPIGRVIYLHQISLAADNEDNGLASLLFNPSKSLYIHHGTPKETFETTSKNNTYDIVVGDPEGYPVYKLHAARKMHSKVSCHLVKGGCIVTDTLGAIEWAIHPERKMFGEYECRRATGVFGRREYEAWFAPDIPISSGPHKLAGLPGLILEAYTTDRKVQFLFNGLELSANVPGTIKMPSGIDVGMTHEELNWATIEHARNVEKSFRAQGQEVSITFVRDIIELLEDDK